MGSRPSRSGFWLIPLAIRLIPLSERVIQQAGRATLQRVFLCAHPERVTRPEGGMIPLAGRISPDSGRVCQIAGLVSAIPGKMGAPPGRMTRESRGMSQKQGRGTETSILVGAERIQLHHRGWTSSAPRTVPAISTDELPPRPQRHLEVARAGAKSHMAQWLSEVDEDQVFLSVASELPATLPIGEARGRRSG